jgi:hypothetical protein
MVPLTLWATAGCGPQIDAGTGGTGTGGGATGTGGAATSGDCSKDDPCPDGQSCSFGPGTCQDGARGNCVGFFQCDGPPTGPVCGCDGKTVEAAYGECGVGQYDTPAGCQVGTFACGPTLQCKRNSDVCVATLAGVPGPTSYACKAFAEVNTPGSCVNGIPYCDCIDLSPMGGATCTADADHQETITITHQ